MSEQESSSITSGFVEPNISIDFQQMSEFSNLQEVPCRGFNCLYRAQRYGKYFMLKGLKPEYRNLSTFQSMLRKELEISIRMDHPNIVHVHSLETVPEVSPCIVMDYVDGRDLDTFLAENPTAAERRKVAKQIVDAMNYFHSLQVVHRDLKPSNILVTRNGNNVRIIDFGLSDEDQYAIHKEPAYTQS